MILPRLPARLRALCELTPGGAVADVGAGHGALAVHLAAGGRRVIATEVGGGALAELEDNLLRWGAREAVEVRAGRGLEPLSWGEVDGAIIAGMGARTVIDVAGAAKDHGLRWLVLQAMQHADRIEPWLAERGWRVETRVDVRQAGRAYGAVLVMLQP